MRRPRNKESETKQHITDADRNSRRASELKALAYTELLAERSKVYTR